MSGLKLFFAILVFVLYQVAVWFLIRQAAPAGVALPVCIFLTACGNTLLALYFVALQQPSQTPSSFVPPAFIQPAPKHPAGKTNPEIGWDAGEAAPALEPLPAQTEPPSLLIAEAQKQLGRPVISDLPVHLLIGIEGCGKTSLIRSSGFAATHLAGQSAPPRNAWLVGDSLLLEQGGPASWADAVESRNLLEALGRQPRLAGVTVCCPIDPFLGVQDAKALGALATRVQAHLREIGAATGDPVSFCLVFTKCDSIPFFADYCGVLADSERQQVLGSALPDLSGQPREMQAKQITDAFNVLYLSLAEKRLTLLSRSAATATRAGVYEFPREMRRMRNGLVQFLADIVQPDPLQPAPRMRGFYFTGSAAAGDPRIQEPILFAAGLFRQILQPARNMAPLPAVAPAGPVRSDRKFWPVSAVALLLLCGCLYSGYRNHTLMQNARAAVAGCPPLAPDSSPSAADLERIDVLRRQVQTLVGYKDRPPLSLRLGLYAGDELLGPLRQVYLRRLQQYLLGPLGRQLEAEFSALPRKRSASYPYDTIRAHVAVYRMISGSGPDREFPAAELASWLLLIWRDSPGWNARSERILAANFALYCDGLRSNTVPGDFQSGGKDPELLKRATDYLHYFKGDGQQGP